MKLSDLDEVLSLRKLREQALRAERRLRDPVLKLNIGVGEDMTVLAEREMLYMLETKIASARYRCEMRLKDLGVEVDG